MSDCVGELSRNPSPLTDNRYDCPIDPYNEACNNTQSLLTERGMGYNPKKNEEPAASSGLRSDPNLLETRNERPRAVDDTGMSQMASFPQDHQHILMENSALDPSSSSLNTPTPGAKWPSDLRHEPPASAAGPMNTPSVVVNSNPVYGGVNAPNSSPFMTRIPQDSGLFQEPN